MKNHLIISRRTQVVTLLAALSMAALPASAITDDFNVGTTLGPDWETIDVSAPLNNGSSSLSGGTLNMGGTGYAATRTDELFGDGVFRVDLQSWTTGVPDGSSQGLLFRYSPSGDSYGLVIDDDGSPTLSLIRLNGFAPTVLIESLPLTLNPAGPSGYILEAVAVGSLLTGNLYNRADNSLLASISLTEGSFASGRAGVLIGNDDIPTGTPFPAASFDNFSAVVPVPEPGTLALFALGAVVTGIGLRKRR